MLGIPKVYPQFYVKLDYSAPETIRIDLINVAERAGFITQAPVIERTINSSFL